MRHADMIRLDLATGTATKMRDCIAEEVPLQITLNDTYSSIIWCTPLQFKELAMGYLYAEDILHSIDDIEKLTLDETKNICQIQFKTCIDLVDRMKHHRRGTRIIPLVKDSTSAYQHDEKLSPIKSELTLKAQIILEAIHQMNQKATGFRDTGALHDSGIFTSDGTMVAFSEDVGRHNTVDKVIGQGLIEHLSFAECFLVITGRVPGDMIYKAAKAGLPIVASVAAVLNSGIASAEKANLTLVGFVRGERMNIYSCPWRILL